MSADGSTLATSSPTAAITLPPAPVNTASPAIAGTPIVGTTLMASNGTWTSPVPITYTYQWYRGTKAVRGATFYPLGQRPRQRHQRDCHGDECRRFEHCDQRHDQRRRHPGYTRQHGCAGDCWPSCGGIGAYCRAWIVVEADKPIHLPVD